MKRLSLLLLSLLVSVGASIVLLAGVGMAGGACHCMTPNFALFPYGTFIWERTSWDNFGFLLLLIQFPLYVTIVMLIKGSRWKVVAVLLIVVLHVLAATFGFRDYCDRRSTCAIPPHRITCERPL